METYSTAKRKILLLTITAIEISDNNKQVGSTTNQNLIEEEMKRRLNSGNACYHSVQKLFFSSAV
jgi:hypothetical protein